MAILARAKSPMHRRFRPEPPLAPAVVTIVEASRASRGLVGRQLREARQRSPQIVLDLGPLTSLDGSGLGEIAAGLRDVLASGGDLKIGGACPSVRAFLALTRLARVVDVHATVDEAIRAFAPETAAAFATPGLPVRVTA